MSKQGGPGGPSTEEVEAPPPPPAPVNEVVQAGEIPTQHVVEGPPTHVVWREYGPEFVHPEGFTEAADLKPLPAGFWDLPDLLMKVDTETRTFVPDIEACQAAKWAGVKARRDELENGQAPTPFGNVQCDERSKQKISGLVQMAAIAAGAGEPFEEEFTLADNSVVTLNAQGAIAMGIAVGRHVSAVYAASRDLRRRIFEQDLSAADVLAIDVAEEFTAALQS